jgi:small-conductance mechanosensitive channel
MTPLLLRAFSLKNKEEGEKLRRGLRTLIPLVLILFAADNSLRVFGAPEGTVGSIESWFAIFYIVFGALIAWVIYLSFVQRTVSRISQSKHIDRKDMDIEPLLRLFGKLIISVMGVAMIMSSLGFNLTAIITSAGIVSLGITLGAQNILNQFFSGMVLLLTHPFKSGDLVRIGNNNVIYRVSSVNIMNTVFENWDNEETVIMPNNAVSSSTIVNVTGGGLTYKIAVFMNVPHDSDVDLARALMAEAATNHPQVLVDGTVDAPSTRVTALLESGIELRLTCYVYDFNDSGKIGGELRDSIFKSFRRNGIKVPYPHIDINLSTAEKKDERMDRDN